MIKAPNGDAGIAGELRAYLSNEACTHRRKRDAAQAKLLERAVAGARCERERRDYIEASAVCDALQDAADALDELVAEALELS